MKNLLSLRLTLLAAAIALTLFAFSSKAAAASGTTGLSPLDPLMVPTDSQTIAPNTTLWFYFDYAVDSSGKTSSKTATASAPAGPGGGGASAKGSSSNAQSAVEVAVDADGSHALQFAVYTPGQANTFAHDDPKVTPAGRGTAYYDTETGALVHDLHWSGGFNASGRYYVALTNTSSQSASFRLTITGASVSLYPATATPTPTPAVTVAVATPAKAAATTVKGKIIFETSTGGDIYTVNGDGSDLTLVTHGIDPSWSPDGTQITFARWDNDAPGLYIANADGSNVRRIFSAPQIRWPRWSPDGQSIVFSQDKSKSDSRTLWKLGLVDVSTGKLTEPQCSDRCYSPTWESDSTTIVYTDPDAGLMKTSILGGSASILLGASGSYYDTSANVVRSITHLPQIQNSETSADGKRITYAQVAHDRWEVHTVNADGSGSTAVTTFDETEYYVLGKVVHNVAPAWSPDGTQILFLSNRNGQWEFFVTDSSGAQVHQVLKNVTDQLSIKFDYENERMADWTN